MKPEEKKGLDNTTIALMISVAVFYDILQWLLVFLFMDWLVSIFALMTFYVWFKRHGISFATPKRATTFVSATAIESVPIISTFLSWLPAWTAAVTIIALDTKVKKVLGQIPGGQMAGNVLSNKMGVAQTNSHIRDQASQINQPAALQHLSSRPTPTSNNFAGGTTPQRMEEWKNSSRRLSDIQTRGLIDKNYKGGTEQYAKDEEKQTADRTRGEEARTKAKNARLAYLEEDRNLNR